MKSTGHISSAKSLIRLNNHVKSRIWRLLFFILLQPSWLTLCAQSVVEFPSSMENDTIIINKNIYGHFAEHLGHCIYSGFYVGDTNQSIPNIDGVRKDVIA